MLMENKYFLPEKALEYAKMSWQQWSENKVSEPFYASLAEEVTRLATRIKSPNPFCLEFGFGAGRILFEISKSFPSAQITGVEISPPMIEVSKSLLSGTAINFIEGSVEEAPIKDNSADLTICINVLDRVRNTTLAIKELIRVTKKGGAILATTALDYELPFTPVMEHLTSLEIIELFVGNGCRIIENYNSELVKTLPNGEEKKYNEFILILWKDN